MVFAQMYANQTVPAKNVAMMAAEVPAASARNLLLVAVLGNAPVPHGA